MQKIPGNRKDQRKINENRRKNWKNGETRWKSKKTNEKPTKIYENQRKTNEIRWKSTNNRRSFRYVSMPVLEAFETFLLFRVGSVLPSIVECCWGCLTCTLVLFGQPFHHCLWNTCSLSFAVCVKNAIWSGASIISCLKFRRLFCTSSVKLSCPVAFQQASQASPTVNAKPKYTPLSKHVLQGTCQLTETIASSSNVEGKRNSSHERLPNAFEIWKSKLEALASHGHPIEHSICPCCLTFRTPPRCLATPRGAS